MRLATLYTRETANYLRVFAKDLQFVVTDFNAVASRRIRVPKRSEDFFSFLTICRG